MRGITKLFGNLLSRNLRCFYQVGYLRSNILKTRHLCTTRNLFVYFNERAFSSPKRTRELCDAPSVRCWKCNYSYSASVDGEAVFFCPSCNVIQEPISDRTYFDLISCKPSFDLDTQYLTEQFRSLQSHLHPDKFSLKSEREQNMSSLQSSLVNEAYQVLLKPLSRGLYLLKLEGLSIEEGDTGSDVEFLSEVMEMNEMLESGTEEMLRELRREVEGKLESYRENASEAFDKEDFLAAKEILSKMKYYDNISEQIREKIMG
ncbi:iron-sulfur cluster co-chaperone protein HscB-like [Dendronephthya gigantea]|uniref:iron-sulfur cluster co-chaperone protein HscB-like n=1 Tax=Dendronephthya gigantea TaxID=151771 RepID=UPI00106DCD4B|nr:iron-sulfur cluster co-chaperone protein HscB-like [Dendronephthya gigantea]XP_028400286.1 iron-sulfur cluster co-chaperone protein HscB-like [Dendronephthya gigantea]